MFGLRGRVYWVLGPSTFISVGVTNIKSGVGPRGDDVDQVEPPLLRRDGGGE